MLISLTNIFISLPGLPHLCRIRNAHFAQILDESGTLLWEIVHMNQFSLQFLDQEGRSFNELLHNSTKIVQVGNG